MSKRSRERKMRKLEAEHEFQNALAEHRREQTAPVRARLKRLGLGLGAAVILALLIWGGFSAYRYIDATFGDIKGPFGQISRGELEANKFATLMTTEGEMKIELDVKNTPKTAANFVLLAQKDFYDGVKFHRIIKDFMIQSGDPNSKDDDISNDGTGGPGYTFDDERLEGDTTYTRGTVAMANNGPDTNGSQFFIVHQDSGLQPSYVIFGHLVEGFEVLDAIAVTPVVEADDGYSENSVPKKDIIIEDVVLSSS